MAAYQTFTSARATEPDRSSLLAQLRALDATAGVQHDPGSATYRIKKATTWTGPQITAAQNVIDTAPASSPQLTAQALIDAMPIFEKAIILTLIDELNILRALHSLPARTVPQAIAAVRTKAGAL